MHTCGTYHHMYMNFFLQHFFTFSSRMKFRDRWPACILFEDFVCVLQVLTSPIFRVGLKCNRVFLKINTSPMGDTDVFLDKVSVSASPTPRRHRFLPRTPEIIFFYIGLRPSFIFFRSSFFFNPLVPLFLSPRPAQLLPPTSQSLIYIGLQPSFIC